ncbi:MAG TPA: carboxypeptidase regulatory-like domain-containing protein, partial [Blastocatellia bacterium]|nr:carboxypeptidase regulatory-like domain-containing protein [Blastocatellia bacterium]
MKPKSIVRMVPRAVITLLFAVMVLAVFVPTALMQQSGGPYVLNPSVIAGGGGTSSNGSTRIDGTVGQGILGSSTGGNFTLNAGFWQSAPAGTVDISGQVTYCAAASPPAVPNATLTVTAGGSGMATTDAMGNYTIASLPAGGSYTVTPSKTGAVSGINTTDASRILQFIAGTFTLTSCQQLAADTSQNGIINTTDVSHILNFIAGNPPVASNHTGEWRFNPASRTYVSVLSNQTSQNYNAMELGEVSGN